ncbi:Uncharacterised protein [Campylobacter geochelonis]|nr:Uncharacterised protein [Campylobacter geochelonis]CZE50819.1 Uncharacterised protein [Campylobacter geochelonis]
MRIWAKFRHFLCKMDMSSNLVQKSSKMLQNIFKTSKNSSNRLKCNSIDFYIYVKFIF